MLRAYCFRQMARNADTLESNNLDLFACARLKSRKKRLANDVVSTIIDPGFVKETALMTMEQRAAKLAAVTGRKVSHVSVANVFKAA